MSDVPRVSCSNIQRKRGGSRYLDDGGRNNKIPHFVSWCFRETTQCLIGAKCMTELNEHLTLSRFRVCKIHGLRTRRHKDNYTSLFIKTATLKKKFVTYPRTALQKSRSRQNSRMKNVWRKVQSVSTKKELQKKQHNIDTKNKKTNILERKAEKVTTSKACSTSPRWKSTGAVSI